MGHLDPFFQGVHELRVEAEPFDLADAPLS